MKPLLWMPRIRSWAGCARISFLIAGTQKGGTTSLEAYLRAHPRLSFPRKIKELHYFDDDACWNSGEPNHARYHGHFEEPRPGVLLGEATPNYTYHPDAVRRIWQYNRDMKLIVLLRNPITRALSHWQMSSSRHAEDRPFSEAIRLEARRLRDAQPKQDPLHSYLDRGFYSEQIRRLDRFFDRRQLLFIKSEEFFADPKPHMRSILAFLQVDAAELDTSRILNAASMRSEMPPEDRAYLRELYRWDIKQVESLLGWDCSDWLAG